MINHLLIALWGIAVIKHTLFWIYLVQLKEYRPKRLIDYFGTASGKRILYNPLIPIFTTNLRRPRFTLKAAILTFVTLLLHAAIAVWFLVHGSKLAILIALIILLLPLPIILLGLFIIKPLDLAVRGRILRRATDKMARLNNLTVIGITGSYGKTSTKEFLASILKTKFKVVKTPEHLNVETGIAQFIARAVNDSYDIFVCEMGGYEKNDIATIVKIVKPKIGVLTGANEQHLALFGSMANLLSAEGGLELTSALPDDGFAVMNGSNKYTRGIYETTDGKKLITSATPDKSANMWAENVKVLPDHIEFKMCSKRNPNGIQFHASLLGAQNIENILLAAATAEELGIRLEDMAKPVSEFKPMDKTMTLSKSPSGINIIDSSYASNPEAVLAHLEYLKSWGKAKKIVVMPSLIELGAAASGRHKEIGERLASVVDLAIITTSDHFSDILLGAKNAKGVVADGKILLVENSGEIVKQIGKVVSNGDVILLEGRSSENIIRTIKQSF